MLQTLSYGFALTLFMIAGNALRLSLLLRHFRDEENENSERARDRRAYLRSSKPHLTAS